jgi:hypothetical protein
MKNALSILLLIMLLMFLTEPGYGWQNGYAPGMNVACSKCYGTHDFLAEHALTFLPWDQVYSWLMMSPSRPYGVFASQTYLYGTEIPDLGGQGFKADWSLHSVYYGSDGSLQDDYAAKHAQQSFEQVLSYLRTGDMQNAAKWMGITSHYVTDVTSFWHVMGKGKEWVNAARNGNAYENWVNRETDSYTAPFSSCLIFDGKLERVSAYDVTLKLAYDTTFDSSGFGRTAKWMDDHYSTTSSYYRQRVCESLSLAANAVADLIYSTTQAEATTATMTTPMTHSSSLVIPTVTVTISISTTAVHSSTVTTTHESVAYSEVGLLMVLSLISGMIVAYLLFRWSRRKAAEDASR